jgi:hypothetical protein
MCVDLPLIYSRSERVGVQETGEPLVAYSGRLSRHDRLQRA